MNSFSTRREDIAVVGVSALFPGSQDATGFWRDILAGRDLITDVPPSHWLIDDYYDADPQAPDKTYAKRGGFLDPVDFDALGFGIPPATMPATDTSQLLALIVAQQVLEDAARGQVDLIDRSRISVILGVTSAQELLFSMVSRLQKPVWVKALRESGLDEDTVQAACARIGDHYVPWQEASFPGLLGNVVAGRIANRLNLGGTNCVTDAACASSFSALAMAVNELQLGDSDLVITGGVDTLNDIFMYLCFSKTPALSASGDCRPFSDAADGTMLGEGLGMVALKRLSDAERDGDRIYAVIKGVGTSSDGRSKSVYAPVSEGQARALQRAYAQAGFGADTVELVEAHGTGTKAGDAAEFEGLRQVYAGSGRTGAPWCALGSVKSQIGHTKAAAGAAGLFKAVMALHHKILPPTIKVAAPNPKLAIERSPFYLNTEARPWIRDERHPRRAAVSAFGFGGSNFHLALEEYCGPHPAERLAVHPCELLLCSADSAEALCAELLRWREEPSAVPAKAYASRQVFDRHTTHRVALVLPLDRSADAAVDAAIAAIRQSPGQGFTRPDGTAYGVGAPLAAEQIALLFPGQGSQYLGMGRELALHLDAARAAFDELADARFEGTALQDLLFPQPVFSDTERAAQVERLTATEWAQPALAACSMAVLAVLRELGLEAGQAAGHSFGELSALCAAGVYAPRDLLDLARRRGEAMRAAAAAAPPGAMLAVSASRETVQSLLQSQDSPLVLANHNAPNQVVLSGDATAIARFETVLAAQGLGGKRLPVASGFHSPLVAAAVPEFGRALQAQSMAPAQLALFGNFDGAAMPVDARERADRIAAQIAAPVRFVDMIEAMHQDGATVFVEVGPGSVLTGLVQTILGDRAQAIATDRRHKPALESLLAALARLAALGAPMAYARLFADVRRDAPKPRKGKMNLPISGANYGKPYPPADLSTLPKPNAKRAPVAVAEPAPMTPVSVATAPLAVNASATAASPASLPVHSEIESESMARVDPALLQTFLETQQQTAAAHAAFQKSMADSHHAFLRVAEQAMGGLNALLGISPTALDSSVAAPVAALVAAMPTAPLLSSTPVAPIPAVAATPAATVITAMAAPAIPAPAVAKPMAAAPVQAAPAIDLSARLLAIVADKTGYPMEMLRLDMDLESDLGVDSIKRVEILAAVEEATTLSARPDRSRLAAMHTLREILAEFSSLSAAPAAAPAPVEAPASVTVAAAVTAAAPLAGANAAAIVLSVVAEKTGYPVDMLNPAMDLEGDLGIDSIKRVEILAAIEDQAPALARADRARLSAMHTLAEIVAYLDELAPVAAHSVASVSATTSTRAETNAAVDAEAALLAVVADKTGYPIDMLHLGMDLEADLGVDSIKRVEILAAFEERLPQLAKADRAVLSSLRTLAEIVAALPQTAAPAPVAVAVSAAVSVSVPSAPTLSLPGTLSRYTLERVAAPACGLMMAGLREHRIDVLGPAELAAATVAALGERGLDARVVEEVDASTRACVDLSGLCEISDRDSAIALQRRQFQRARVLAAGYASAGGLWVSVQDTGGSFGIGGIDPQRAWLSGAPALIKTAALEWPKAALKAIDLERGARSATDIAAAVVEELCAGGAEIEIGLSAKGDRHTLLSVERPVRPSAAVIQRGDVVLVSGGARGVTAACLIEWAKAAQPSLVLLGRTALIDEPACCRGVAEESGLKKALLAEAMAARLVLTPSELQARVKQVLAGREVAATLAALHAAGSQARYLAVDVEDRAALAAALADVRAQMGPIAGLVHAAGVLADKRISEKTDAQFDAVFNTKVRGLAALLDATVNDPLKLLAVFSSVSARCGNTGQADYAMANETIAKVARAEARRRPGLRVRSLGWGPWEGGMVTPHLKARFAELGVPMIPLAIGARMFADEMRDARVDDVELVLGGEPRPEALLSAGAEAREIALDVRIDRHSHRYLDGHAIDGVPVVPTVLVADWFARAVRGLRPGMVLSAISDFQVLKGIRLQGFERDGDAFRILARTRPDSRGLGFDLSLIDAQGTPRYRAVVELAAQLPRAQKGLPDLEASRWDGGGLYDQWLFHRGAFELIDTVHGVSDEGACVALRGIAKAGWSNEPWQLDVAALDAALQTAVLFGQRVLGGPSLPTGFAALRCFAEAPPRGGLRARVYRRKLAAGALTTDIVVVDESGRRYAEFQGVLTVALPRSHWTSQAA